ncbi:MAG: proteasome subunit beta [Promethearchaeota archaeon]
MSRKTLPFNTHFNLNYKVVDLEKSKEEIAKQKGLGNLKTGTTTVGLVCKDGVCLATDRRATMEYYIASKTAEKLHQIQPHLWMTIAGSVADAQYLIDIIKAETNLFQIQHKIKVPVIVAANILRNTLYRYKGFFGVGLILGGITKEKGPELYDIGGYGSLLPEKYCSVGSGSTYAIGLLEAKYKEDLSVEEGMKIAATAVRSAIIRDIFSGNGIDVVGIKVDSFKREFYPIDKDPLAPK